MIVDIYCVLCHVCVSAQDLLAKVKEALEAGRDVRNCEWLGAEVRRSLCRWTPSPPALLSLGWTPPAVLPSAGWAAGMRVPASSD
jgi:hypothetical protein